MQYQYCLPSLPNFNFSHWPDLDVDNIGWTWLVTRSFCRFQPMTNWASSGQPHLGNCRKRLLINQLLEAAKFPTKYSLPVGANDTARLNGELKISYSLWQRIYQPNHKVWLKVGLFFAKYHGRVNWPFLKVKNCQFFPSGQNQAKCPNVRPSTMSGPWTSVRRGILQVIDDDVEEHLQSWWQT